MNLTQFTIGTASLSEGKIFLGKLDKNRRTWLHKKDVTQEFMELMIGFIGENKIMDIHGNEGSHYEITCKKIS
jgi:hypothetical protein